MTRKKHISLTSMLYKKKNIYIYSNFMFLSPTRKISHKLKSIAIKYEVLKLATIPEKQYSTSSRTHIPVPEKQVTKTSE